jgi:hypothetical protein
MDAIKGLGVFLDSKLFPLSMWTAYPRKLWSCWVPIFIVILRQGMCVCVRLYDGYDFVGVQILLSLGMIRSDITIATWSVFCFETNHVAA